MLKKTITFLLVIGILFSVTACGPEEAPVANLDTATARAEVSAIPTSIAPVATPAPTVQDDSIHAILANTPDHISQSFSESFIVDAPVSVPIVSKADVLFAEYKPFDEQKIAALFFEEEGATRELSTYIYTDDTILYQNGETYARIGNGSVRYQSEGFRYYKFPTESFRAKYEAASPNLLPFFYEVYTAESLDFLSPAEAVAEISDVLSEISVDAIENTELYAIDYKTMQAQQDERIQEDIDNQKRSGFSPITDPTESYTTKETFTQEDDFYIACFRTLLNGIPVTPYLYSIMSGERWMNGSVIRASFSQKGIIELDCSAIYQQTGIVESPETIVSVEDALQKVYESEGSIISTDKVTITEIAFEYAPIAYNDDYWEAQLVPAWSFLVNSEFTYEGNFGDVITRTQGRVIFINAITGEVIR